jgi:hypothetical protein
MPDPQTLLERLRQDLAAEGAAPSRARLEAFIRAGAARVAGRVVTDPAAAVPAGAPVAFDPDDADPAALLAARSERREPIDLPAGVLHADAQLVVLLAESPAAASDRLGPDGPPLVAVPDPSAPGSGPVLRATSPAVAVRLGAAIREGRVLETLLALRAPPLLGAGESVEVTGDGAALVRREEAPLGPPPAGTRDVVPPARLLLALKHPRTNRRLVFTAEPPAAFGAGVERALRLT